MNLPLGLFSGEKGYFRLARGSNTCGARLSRAASPRRPVSLPVGVRKQGRVLFHLTPPPQPPGIANAASSAILTIPMSPLTPSGKGKPTRAGLAPALAKAEEEVKQASGSTFSFAQRITASLRNRVRGM